MNFHYMDLITNDNDIKPAQQPAQISLNHNCYYK